LSLFLDEIANTTPVPLDLWSADSRGWGITVCAVAQDLAQLESRWGRTRAQTIFSNLPTKVVLPGVANNADLDLLAYLAGHRRVRQTSEGASEGSGSRSRSTHRSWALEPVVTGHMIYGLPRWHAYVLGLGPRAVVVRFEPGYRHTRRALRRLERQIRRHPSQTPTATNVNTAPTVGVVTPIRPRPAAGDGSGDVPELASSEKLG
jgi:type IV secretion system protein VirD4